LGNNRVVLGGANTRAQRSGAWAMLVEREQELHGLDRTLEAARAGTGHIVVIDAPPGKGKTRLLMAAEERAKASGMQVFAASASELERNFPFGVAIQLFELAWTSADEDVRTKLSAGPAHLAGALLDGQLHDASPSEGDQSYPVIHGLFWLACNLATSESGTESPLAIIVDDAQWVDQPSLQFLAYIAARLSDQPIALLIALRPGEDPADQAALAALQHAPAATVLRPSSLSPRGVELVVRKAFPDADRAFVSACGNVTQGNPFLLTEFLAQVQADQQLPNAETAARLTDLIPEAIVNAVVARLGAISAPARALASALAVLGDRIALQDAARLAELDSHLASEAADALSEVHLLNPGLPLSFVHPVIRSAILASMAPLSRGRAHRRAASILHEEGAAAEAIAAHLLASPADSDPKAVEALRVAAQHNLSSGDAHSAARLLARALDEQPASNLYPEVLAELGQAEAQAGLPQASERLEEAITVIGEPKRRAELAMTQGRALMSRKSYREAADVLDSGLSELDGREVELADELEAAFISAASLVPELVPEGLNRRQKMLSRLHGAPSPQQRSAVAHSIVHDSLRGEPRAHVRRLADLAWAGGSLLHARPEDHRSLPSLTAALVFADELEHSLEICETALQATREHESALSGVVVSSCRAWALYEQGAVAEAAADAEVALDAPDDFQANVRTAYGALACCRLQRGQLEQAEKALAILEDEEIRTTVRHACLLEVRAQLRLAQHRPREALEDALRAGQTLESEFGVLNPGAVAWRSTAALAELALGRADRGEELAADELERAQRIGVTRVVIRDLRVLGLAVGGKTGIELLEQAVQTAREYGPRLESTYALVDLGAALRRAKKRSAAREPLRQALELSHRHGAAAIAERARTELAATGARPRRVMLSGVESLTPSERRVASLAARGMTTRMIAEALFITPKTVEYHLRHTYQKLDVSSRSQLAATLGDEPAT
jgi:DNA-binding NarL/FixJ family response regulator